MPIEGVVPSPEFNEQLKRVVRENTRGLRSDSRQKGRWHKKGGGKGSARVAFYVVELICPDDDLYDAVDVPTLVVEWIWHTARSTPRDAYGSDSSLLDVIDLGCILDTVTKDDINGATEPVYGEATYGYLRDDPDGFWKLDSLCIQPDCTEDIEGA